MLITKNTQTTNHIILKFTDDNKKQTFDTRLPLNKIRKLEKNPKTHQKETKKHRFIDFSYNNRCFTNYHNSTLPDRFRVDSYNLKTVLRVFSMLQCNKTTIKKKKKHTKKKLKNTVLLIFHIKIVVLLTITIVHCQTASELIVTT